MKTAFHSAYDLEDSTYSARKFRLSCTPWNPWEMNLEPCVNTYLPCMKKALGGDWSPCETNIEALHEDVLEGSSWG